MTAVDQEGPFVFEVPASKDPIDLKNILLSIECKLTKKNNADIAADETVGPVNNTLHTLFSQVELQLGKTIVSYNHSLYPYQAYLEELLYSDKSELEGRLQMQGFILDKAGKGGLANPEANPHNEGLKKRRDELFELSRNTALIGRLHCDIFKQDKYLIEGVPMRITLHKTPPEFYLMKTGGTEYKVNISAIKLMVPRISIGEAMRRSLESRMANNMVAYYNVNRTVMHTHLIPGGVSSFHVPNLFRGQLPHTVILAMAAAANRTPNYAKNPFVFEEFNLKEMILSRNNVPINYKNGLQVDYSAGYGYSSAYLNLLRNTNKMKGGSLISHYAFKSGYNVYPFKVVPQEDLYTDASALNEGVLDLKITLSADTNANVDLFVYAQYNSCITIDKERVVRVDGMS